MCKGIVTGTVKGITGLALRLAEPVLRLLVVAAFTYAYLGTLNISDTENTYAAIEVAALWGLPIGAALHPDYDIGSSLDGELIVLAMVTTHTLSILNHVSASIGPWLFPVIASAIFIFVRRWRQELHYAYTTLPDSEVEYNVVWERAMILVYVASGLVEILATPDLTLTQQLLILADTLLSILLIVTIFRHIENQQDKLWQGGSSFVLCCLYIRCVDLATLPSNSVAFYVDFTLLLCMVALLPSINVVSAEERASHACYNLQSAILTVAELVFYVLSSVTLYCVLIIASVAVLCWTLDKPWYTARSEFPGFITSASDFALTVIDKVLVPVYSFFNNPDLQRLVILVAPQLLALRATIYRILKTVYPKLLLVDGGAVFELTPTGSESGLPLACLVLGPIQTALGAIAQVFPEGKSFARSRWYWAFCALMNLFFVLETEFIEGISVTAVHMLFPLENYSRTYTNEGYYALVAQLVLLGSCIILFLILSNQESAELKRVVRTLKKFREKFGEKKQAKKKKGTAGRPFVFRDKEDVETVEEEQQASWCEVLWAGIGDSIASTTFIFAVGGVLVLIFTAVGRGSPITTVNKTAIPLILPDGIILTDLDKAGAVATTFVTFLENAIGPEATQALIANAMIAVIVEEFGCVACLCIPLGEVKSIVDDVGGFFSGLSATREMHTLSTNEGMNAFRYRVRRVALSRSNRQSPTQRRLLDFDWIPGQCDSGSSSCDGLSVCLADVLKPTVAVSEFVGTLITTGISYAVKFIVDAIAAGISAVDKLNELWQKIPDMYTFENFEILDGVDISVPTSFFTLNLHLVSFWSVPTISSPSQATLILVTTVVAVSIALAIRYEVARPAFQSALLGVQLSAAILVLTVVFGVAILGFKGVDLVKTEFNYQLTVVWADPTTLVLYGIGILLVVMACYFKVGEGAMVEFNTLDKYLDEIEQLAGLAVKEKGDKKKKKRDFTEVASSDDEIELTRGR